MLRSIEFQKVGVCISTGLPCIYIHTHIHIYIYIHTYIHTYTRAHVCVCVCVRARARFRLAPDLVERNNFISRRVSVVNIIRHVSNREITRTSLIH